MVVQTIRNNISSTVKKQVKESNNYYSGIIVKSSYPVQRKGYLLPLVLGNAIFKNFREMLTSGKMSA